MIRDPSGDIITVNSVTTNTGKATIEGFDVALQWRDTYSWGTPSVGLIGTYMSKFDQASPGGVISHKVGTIVDSDCNPVLDSDTGGVIPRWKHALQFGYGYAGWQATLIQNYYDGYQTGCDLNGNQHSVGSQALYDLQVAYTGIKNLRLAIGARNLFDKDPPIFIPVSNQFQAGYDIAMYDPRGRFIYGSVAYKFDFPRAVAATPAPVAPAPAPVVTPPPPPAPTPPPPPPPAPQVQKITLDSKVLFDFDKAVLKPEGMAAIDAQVANKLAQVQRLEVVLVTGHTDRLGTEKYNQGLSERRADAVRDYLVSKGVPKDKIETIGMGEKQPVVQCDQKNFKELVTCLQPNRRVDVQVKGETVKK